MGAFSGLAGAGMVGGAVSAPTTGLLAKYANLNTIFIVDPVLYLVVLAWVLRLLAARADVPATPAVPGPGNPPAGVGAPAAARPVAAAKRE